MLSTILRSIAILSACIVFPPQASAPVGIAAVSHQSDSPQQSPASGIDPKAVAFLRQTEKTYKEMLSYSVEFRDVPSGPHTLSNGRGKIYYRAPNRVAYFRYGLGPEPLALRMDGKRLYISQPTLPDEYIEVAFKLSSPFATCWALERGEGVGWLSELFAGKDLLTEWRPDDIISLHLEPETMVDGISTQKLVAVVDYYDFVGSKKRSKYHTLSLTIGTKDHLVYQTTNTDEDQHTHTIHYTHLQPDAVLYNAEFEPPANATRLPFLRVLNVSSDIVILDKGNRMG